MRARLPAPSSHARWMTRGRSAAPILGDRNGRRFGLMRRWIGASRAGWPVSATRRFGVGRGAATLGGPPGCCGRYWLTTLLPGPPSRVSRPAPPLSTSSPAPPRSVSAPAPPLSASLPSPPYHDAIHGGRARRGDPVRGGRRADAAQVRAHLRPGGCRNTGGVPGDPNPAGPCKLLSPLFTYEGQRVWSERLARAKAALEASPS